jgi:hypothetical protein
VKVISVFSIWLHDDTTMQPACRFTVCAAQAPKPQRPSHLAQLAAQVVKTPAQGP